MDNKSHHPTQRRPYTAPKLTCYGRIVNLTQNGSAMNAEQAAMNAMQTPQCSNRTLVPGIC